MIMQTLDIDSKRVYKSASTKVASGRNNLSGCAYPECTKWEKLGNAKFPVCASCKHSRYCNREHQVQDWERHKKECKDYRARDQKLGIHASSNQLTEAQIIANLLEDFIQLHESTLHRIFNYTYHSRLVGTGIHLDRIHVRVNLRYHSDCNRNPARGFHFRNLEVTELIIESIQADDLRCRDDYKTNRRNDPDFIDCIRCVYQVDSPAVQQAAWCPIYKEDVPERLTYEWYRMMLGCLENGIVLRKVKSPTENKMVWAPGIMVQSGSRWIWREGTIEGIRSAGVKVPSIDIWGRRKKSGVIYLPGGKIPWVAPVGYSWEE